MPAAALNELLHVLRDDAPARPAARGLPNVHASLCSQLPGIGARYHAATCAQEALKGDYSLSMLLCPLFYTKNELMSPHMASSSCTHCQMDYCCVPMCSHTQHLCHSNCT